MAKMAYSLEEAPCGSTWLLHFGMVRPPVSGIMIDIFSVPSSPTTHKFKSLKRTDPPKRASVETPIRSNLPVAHGERGDKRSLQAVVLAEDVPLMYLTFLKDIC